jgi:hypothetical protein
MRVRLGLRSVYKYSKDAIKTLCSGTSVTCDRQALDAALAVLNEGGDIANGVIAFSSAALGGGPFVSFDRQAVRILRHAGQKDVRLIGGEP